MALVDVRPAKFDHVSQLLKRSLKMYYYDTTSHHHNIPSYNREEGQQIKSAVRCLSMSIGGKDIPIRILTH